MAAAGTISRNFRTLKLAPSPLLIAARRFSSQSQQRKQLSLSNIFQRYGFSPLRVPEFISKNRPFLLNLSLVDVDKSLGILSSSLRIPHESLAPMVFDCPGVLELDFVEKWDMVFNELGVSLVSGVGIANLIKLSRRFGVNPDGFVSNYKALKDLEVSDDTVSRILEEFPGIVAIKRCEIYDKVEFLVGIGIWRNGGIDRVLCAFPGLLGLNLEGRIKLLLAEFSNLGFGDELIRKEIIREPRILSMELGEISRCLDLLRSLRCREAIRQKIFDGGALRAGFEVKLRVDCLCRYGMIRRDAFTVLWKEPRVILHEVEEIKRKVEFLLNEMKYGVESLVDVPEYFGANFEKQIIPRYNVIEYLRSRGGLGDPVRLRDLIKPSRLRFYNLYVKPYPECEKLYGRYAADEVKSRHPVGLWKLCRPQKFPESEEDVRNIRSFMESLCSG